MARAIAVLLVVLAAGCGAGSGGGSGGGDGDGAAGPGSPLVLVAGMVAVAPSEPGPWAEAIDFARLGLPRSSVDAHYDLSTPAGEPFLFDLVSRRPGNAGEVRVSLAHAADDGNVPAGGLESMAAAGIAPMAPGLRNRAPWLEALGDGFSRVSVRGAVAREQVFAVRARAGDRDTAVLVRVRPGPESAINLAARPGSDHPGILDSRTIYSSDSWAFGLPAVASSGDRTTVVAYEGDLADPLRGGRYEMRLQVDGVQGTVTGGASEEAGPDSGNWRDHEVAGLFNTLALVRSGSGAVTLRLSFDRGATFSQEEVLGGEARDGWFLPRLAQVAMAADYGLAVLYWWSGPEGRTDLVLVEGRPSAFDGGGSPSRYAFDPPVVLRGAGGDVSPSLTGACWSEAGDLVVGYAFTRFTSDPVDRTWTSTTQTRCAVRPWGGEFHDTLVEEDVIVGKDPSVAVLGGGPALRVLLAYEASDGVRLRTSEDAGMSFGPPLRVGDESASVPTVLAREQGGRARVDVLYQHQGREGCELRTLHWDAFGEGDASDWRLTTAEWIESAGVPKDRPLPGAGFAAPAPESGYRVREVAWLGYDAHLDGDDVVVVYDEVTYDAWTMVLAGWGPGVPAAGGVILDDADGFLPATPPPLAPGLTEPVPPPDPDHMHQLKMLRLD
jgi:hypothetical protein